MLTPFLRFFIWVLLIKILVKDVFLSAKNLGRMIVRKSSCRYTNFRPRFPLDPIWN
ncbi:hypothetical protein GLOIN_2v838232 [Rhizophagus irregularis DAOM 181602=DAOM 197198]|uniref:Uncharacterized protein n=1 Tax=Rhizophagus irregularis (strain DAOM 181602 / DAOM 197198 / MUCL 43194) TaxID=747089 RepID=A0A2P4QGX5_RHIID|nr:hypothetical protein GLOIN_2v838232 [Rhizophagus irregularis DAOM 181602=DAOM 197198]POG76892.1 hypothetical protein GLOIN_2v838232 [Rhizophagus irregularis DAOM 181602=DAOM 197198]|eukprot:XP_025183758.1 hypothetical protein GLOIN_2v838232 [Rhizophagus irregularis DAOM 181602=DAOM 197198]